MNGVNRFKARLGANIQESMGGTSAGAGGPLPNPAHGVPGRYDGVTRPKDVLTIAVQSLRPDPDQPRREFDDDDLRRLADSLKSRGQLQPIRVRWDQPAGAWVIVSGERRWRAAGMAGLATLACVEAKGDLSPDAILEDQLVENCLRSDLKPVEEAHAYKALMERRGVSARQLAESLSLSHMAVNRALALLDLPESVRDQVERGVLPPSSAYEVGRLDDPALQAEVAAAAVAGGLNRAEITELVQAVREEAGPGRQARPRHHRPRRRGGRDGAVEEVVGRHRGPGAAQGAQGRTRQGAPGGGSLRAGGAGSTVHIVDDQPGPLPVGEILIPHFVINVSHIQLRNIPPGVDTEFDVLLPLVVTDKDPREVLLSEAEEDPGLPRGVRDRQALSEEVGRLVLGACRYQDDGAEKGGGEDTPVGADPFRQGGVFPLKAFEAADQFPVGCAVHRVASVRPCEGPTV